MNTPLHQTTKLAWINASTEHSNRDWSKPHVDQLSPDEYADMILKRLEGFVLDWRRVEDGLPLEACAVLLAGTATEAPEGGVGYGEVVFEAWFNGVFFVYPQTGESVARPFRAWSLMPSAPRPVALIGFAPRHHAPAAAPAPAPRAG